MENNLIINNNTYKTNINYIKEKKEEVRNEDSFLSIPSYHCDLKNIYSNKKNK